MKLNNSRTTEKHCFSKKPNTLITVSCQTFLHDIKPISVRIVPFFIIIIINPGFHLHRLTRCSELFLQLRLLTEAGLSVHKPIRIRWWLAQDVEFTPGFSLIFPHRAERTCIKSGRCLNTLDGAPGIFSTSLLCVLAVCPLPAFSVKRAGRVGQRRPLQLSAFFPAPACNERGGGYPPDYFATRKEGEHTHAGPLGKRE